MDGRMRLGEDLSSRVGVEMSVTAAETSFRWGRATWFVARVSRAFDNRFVYVHSMPQAFFA